MHDCPTSRTIKHVPFQGSVQVDWMEIAMGLKSKEALEEASRIIGSF